MTCEEQNKIDDKIESNVNQYKVDRINADISAFSSGDLNKYEFLKRIDLNYKPNALDKARFEFSPLGRAFNEGLDKTIPDYQEEGVIKLLKEIRDYLAGGINIPAQLVIHPGPQGPPPSPSPSPSLSPPPMVPYPSPTNITTPATLSPSPTNITTPTTPSPSSSLTNVSPSSSLANVTPLGSKRSRIPRPSTSQSDLDLKDLFKSQKRIDLDKLKSDLEYSDMMDKLKSRPDFDVNKLLDELRSQEPVSTSSIPAQDEEPVAMPKLKPISKNFTFKGYDDLRRGLSIPTTRSRKDQYDDKIKEPSKIPKPSKSLKPQGVGEGEWAKYAIELNNIKTEKIIIEYLESKLRDMDPSSKEASETINQIEKMKNRIPKLEQELREYYEDLIRRDREYRMSQK